jgi:HEAT repeat protein
MTAREFTDREIESFVQDLESLRGGSMAAAALIGCGARAIPPLRRFLLEGRPRGIFQPRQLAVETLGQLDAKDVLIEYLEKSREIEDAVVRFGENAVRSTAARELGRWPTDEVFQSLIHVGLDHLLPGIVETLGEFRRIEAVPYFLWALGDGVCRSFAEAAIRRLGSEAQPFLVDAACNRNPSKEEENPSSLERRRWVLRILSGLEILPQDWEKLKGLLEEDDPEIVMRTSRIGLEVAPVSDRLRAVQRLIEMLPRVDWFLRSDARTALLQHLDISREAIEDEIARRTAASERDGAFDVILHLLINIRIQALKPGVARR